MMKICFGIFRFFIYFSRILFLSAELFKKKLLADWAETQPGRPISRRRCLPREDRAAAADSEESEPDSTAAGFLRNRSVF